MSRHTLHLLATVAAATGCGGDDTTSSADASATADASPGVDASSCPRTAAAPDRTRYGVIARPTGADASQRNEWEVFSLTVAGDLTATGQLFSMGRSPFGRIEFTPDGEIGVVAQDDGSLGVFALDSAGAATVVHAGLQGSFYAGSVAISSDGERVYVVDSNTRDNGGGVYELRIGCDGTLTEVGMVLAARSPQVVIEVAPNRWLVAARDAVDSPPNLDLHLVDPTGPTWISGVQLFADGGQLVTQAVLSADGSLVAVGDNSPFSGQPQRVAIASLAGDTLAAVQTLSPVADPFDLVASPFDNNFLVASGDGGNALLEATFVAGNPAAPYALSELSYVGQRPQLPANAVMIRAGTLTGRVLIAENVAIRQAQFGDGVAAVDLGAFAAGSGLAAIVGAIGVQP